MSDTKERTYRGGPRNTIYDLTQNSVWRGVNGKILDRKATILVPPHDGAKGLLRVKVVGHGVNGGKEIRTSPEVESFLGDYRLVTAGIAGTVTQTEATVTPAVATTPTSVMTDKSTVVRHYLGQVGHASNGNAACGLHLTTTDRWTADRGFVTGCDVCVAVATGKRVPATVVTAPPAVVDLSQAIETYERGYIIRGSNDIVVEVLTGSVDPVGLWEIVKHVALPKPVLCGTVTVGHIRGLRYEPKTNRGPAYILATLNLIDSWRGKSFKDINVFIHGGSLNDVTHVELCAKSSATMAAKASFTAMASSNTLTNPNMTAQSNGAMRFTMTAATSVKVYNELEEVYSKTTAGYTNRSTDERSVVVTTGKASLKTMRDLVSKLHNLPLKVLHNGASVGTVERVTYQPRYAVDAHLEAGLHLIEPWSTMATKGEVEVALVRTTDPNAWFNGSITYHCIIDAKITSQSFTVTDEGVMVVDIPKVPAKEVAAPVKSTAATVPDYKPVLAAVGTLYDPASPNNPTPGKASFVLQSSEETLAADKAIKIKEAEEHAKEFAAANPVIAAKNATIATLQNLLGFSFEDWRMLDDIGQYKSKELSNSDADLKVSLTLQQTLLLIVRTEHKRMRAEQAARK